MSMTRMVAGVKCRFCRGPANQLVRRHGGKACSACGTMYHQGVSYPETDWKRMPWFLERLRTTDEIGHVVWKHVPAWTMLVLERYSWEVEV